MLKYMRQQANGTVVWLIIGAIAVVFIFFGIGGGGGSYQMISVNGEDINPYDYENMVREVSRAQGGGASEDDKMVKLQAISELVSRTLMIQFGRQIGLTPSDWALGKNIAAIPEFQVDGRFDRAKYESELALMRTNKTDFEQSVRKEMLGRRLDELIGGMSQVYDREALEVYRYQEDQVAFDYIFFPAGRHWAGLNPGEAQLAAYYGYNQEKWRRPAVMTVEYVEIDPAEFLDQAQVGENELLEAYNDNKARFSNPESAEVSHILIKFPSLNPSDEERQKTLERAEAAYGRARTEDFAALAKELSEDPGSAAEGGSLGQITRGMTFDNFEQEAFSAPIGQVSRPVATDIGYHLIKVTDRREPESSSFEAVKETLLNELKAAKARQAATVKLEDLLIRTETNPKLADAAASMGLETKTSPSFTQDQPIDIFVDEQEELAKAFGLALGKIGTVENEKRLLLYSPATREESHVPPLAEIREQVALDWKADEALRLARQEASGFLTLAAEKGWEAAAKAQPDSSRLNRGRSPLAGRGALMENGIFNQVDRQDFMAAVHSVARIGQVSPLSVAGSEAGQPGCFVLRLSDYQPADVAGFDGQLKDMFKMMLSMNRGNLMYKIWRGELYDASKEDIIVPDSYL